MKNFKIIIFQIENSNVIGKLLIYEILNNFENTLSKKGTFTSHIQKSSLDLLSLVLTPFPTYPIFTWKLHNNLFH